MKIPISKTRIARRLRKNSTPHEQKLWKLLRNRRFAGYKFRRQFCIDKYFVDFCCLDKKLVIELDGSQHNTELGLAGDLERDRAIQSLGYTILRFWNHDVDLMIDSVLEKIYQELEKQK